MALKQTFLTTNFKSIFKVDLAISVAWSPEYRLLNAISIASLTGTLVYRLFPAKKQCSYYAPILTDSCFLRASGVDVSMLATGTLTEIGVKKIFKLY